MPRTEIADYAICLIKKIIPYYLFVYSRHIRWIYPFPTKAGTISIIFAVFVSCHVSKSLIINLVMESV